MTTHAHTQASPDAAQRLKDAIGDGMSPFADDADLMMGETDCPNGCTVEPDGTCHHGYTSAAITAGVI